MRLTWHATATVVTAVAVLASGCQRVPPILKPGESTSQPKPTVTTTEKRRSAPQAETQAPKTPEQPPKSETGQSSASKPEPPPVPPAKPDVKPLTLARLKGETQDATRGLLGAPDARGESPPATVWTYREGPCRLKLFFYYDLNADTRRALTVELVPGSPATGARAACLTAFARRSRDVTAQPGAS